MPDNISKIGSVTEKSFNNNKLNDFKEQKANEKDADAFNDLLKDQKQNESLSNANIQEQAAVDQKPSGLGDRILNSFQGVKDNIDAQHEKFTEVLNSSDILSMKDMLQTQSVVANLTLTQELLGKVVGKSAQIVETMSKQQ